MKKTRIELLAIYDDLIVRKRMSGLKFGNWILKVVTSPADKSLAVKKTLLCLIHEKKAIMKFFLLCEASCAYCEPRERTGGFYDVHGLTF